MATAALSRALKRTGLGFIPTMQPTLVDEPPDGHDWLHEIKHDGYRTEIIIEGQDVRAFTRNGNDWTAHYQLIVAAAKSLPCSSAIIDGEVIVQDEAGRSDFDSLRRAIGSQPERLIFYAFDLLHLDGRDIRDLDVLTRRSMLHDLIGEHDPGFPIQFSEHVIGNGTAMFEAVENMELEGIVSKQIGTRYRSGRVTSWVKTKTFVESEFVIVGTEQGVGPTTALLAREAADGLEYVGGAMLTLTNKDKDRFWSMADQLGRNTPPLKVEKRKAAHWLEPLMRARIRYLRGSDKLRHATVRELLV
ncbi:non-homologous end-joining DNA ligase [Sphingobium bisphenolivorans]|uniref:non-homologous end-joining DNA ligase n=1 Tax=Sphingobium bisphenolivorans TaxID=1335760 RepID=UPI0003A1E84A|nr:non-homologous end-joining DNA ligase [Sphingobium bisphenolivorans]